eukprot:comp23608_c0_seq1/m.40136 comp23608_c0_seq1/g.40136  ORF comp23608_c0_seq1/g.40136 comp23608_c0_seq1/m.40136 type:complete len:307 (-) comp23608_c0_seq1:399-1319(-)
MARQLLEQTSVSSLLESKGAGEVITLEHNTTIADALETLARQGIQAAPVVMGGTVEDGYEGGYLGIADVASLLHAFVQGVLAPYSESERWLNVQERSEEFLSHLLITAMGHDASLLYKADLDHSLLELVEKAFLAEHSHRVAVFDEHGTICAMVTQSDIIRLLFANIDSLGPVADVTLAQLGITAKPVVSVGLNTPAGDALGLLAERGLSGVAVVDGSGRLVANVSASDFRGITNFERLPEPLERFLDFDKKKAPKTYYVVTVALEDTLRTALNLYVTEGVHRLYMVDSEGRPTGVITMSDLLAVM